MSLGDRHPPGWDVAVSASVPPAGQYNHGTFVLVHPPTYRV
jgi:hypothetical protein